MNCPKHPQEKMTLLFTGYICDVCEPPKGISTKKELKFFRTLSFLTSIGFPLEDLQRSENEVVFLMTGSTQDMYMADVVLRWNKDDEKDGIIQFEKHRWMKTWPLVPFTPAEFRDLDEVAMPVGDIMQTKRVYIRIHYKDKVIPS